MPCKKVEKGKKLRSVDMKRETSLRVLMGCSTEKSFSCRHAVRSSTGCPLPEPAEELEHRKRGWGYSAQSWKERPTCYCLMGGDTDCPHRYTGRKGSVRAATWDVITLHRRENFSFSGKWNTETEVHNVCWTFIFGDIQKCPEHGPEQPDQMGCRLDSRMD